LLWLLHVAEEQFGRWDLAHAERRSPASIAG
jgi:hypothetical protein